jgi:hypothetical protein
MRHAFLRDGPGTVKAEHGGTHPVGIVFDPGYFFAGREERRKSDRRTPSWPIVGNGKL